MNVLLNDLVSVMLTPRSPEVSLQLEVTSAGTRGVLERSLAEHGMSLIGRLE